MMRWSLAGVWCALIVLAPSVCAAQETNDIADVDRRGRRHRRPSGAIARRAKRTFRIATVRGILANAGYRVNPRMDVGAEVFWVPLETASGTLNTTHIDAVAQFRPWRTHGFFIKGGAGMAFIRNWVDTSDLGRSTQRRCRSWLAGGWAFRVEKRVGFQLFASQHAGALGDLQTSPATFLTCWATTGRSAPRWSSVRDEAAL